MIPHLSASRKRKNSAHSWTCDFVYARPEFSARPCSTLAAQRTAAPAPHNALANRKRSVDLLHDSFGESNGISNRAIRRRRRLRAVLLSELARCQNRCRNQNDALASFVHAAIIYLSLYLRHRKLGQQHTRVTAQFWSGFIPSNWKSDRSCNREAHLPLEPSTHACTRPSS